MTADDRSTVNTRASLVAGLAGRNRGSMVEFCQVCGPVIRGFAVKTGLSETDADEVARAMGMNVAAIDLTKHRVAAALKREDAALQEQVTVSVNPEPPVLRSQEGGGG